MSMLKIWKFKKEVEARKRTIYHQMQAAPDTKEGHEYKKQVMEEYLMYDKMVNPGGHIDKNTLLTTGASVLMLLATLHYEKLDIITSKCWGWIRPPKS